MSLPMVLWGVAALALVGCWAWKVNEKPHEVAFLFPPGVRSSTAVVSLRSCATIEEAMLFKVMGVVHNESEGPLKYPTAHVAFLNDRGEVLDRGQGVVIPEILEADSSGRFVLVTRPDSRIAAVSVMLTDSEGVSLAADYSLRDPAQGFVHP